jgi:hypothetical protein
MGGPGSGRKRDKPDEAATSGMLSSLWALDDYRFKLEVLCEHYCASELGGITLDAEKLTEDSVAAFGALRPLAKSALPSAISCWWACLSQ